jgi:5-formyltetrahydrofolate cyclo-ligase
MSEKAELRKRWTEREAGLPENYIKKSNAGIIYNLLNLQEFRKAAIVLFFYSIWSEPDTHEMIRRAFDLGKIVALPKTYPKGIMIARKIAEFEELTPSGFGIPEPAESAPVIGPDELDFVVVPAVAFDREGYRLGHGAGYYDRYLSCTRAFACGIAREKMLVPCVPREKHDIRVNCIVTENEVIRFRQPPKTPK